MKTYLLFALTALVLLTSCKQELDLTSDITQGWDGHAWGTDQQTLIDEMSLGSADKETVNGMTYVKTGQVRKLGDASVGVKYVFTEDKFAGVSLSSITNGAADDARSALTQWFGGDAKDDKWSKGMVEARLEEGADAFIVVIIDTGQISEISEKLENTQRLIDQAQELIEKNKKELAE